LLVADFTQTITVSVKGLAKLKLTKSSVPSKVIDPPLAELYSAPLRVPVFPLPLKSVQVVPVVG
jgi:hypothetical protein